MSRFVSSLAGALVISSATMVSAQARGSFERTLTVDGPARLEVSTGAGSIDVRTGADGTVHIRAEIRAKSSWADEVRRVEANPPIEQDGNIINVGHVDDRQIRRHVAISYELVVPADTELDSRSGSGSQKIADIGGPLEITTGSGSLDIGRIGDSVEARTGSGSIEIDGVDGDLDLTTGSGPIRAEDVAGAIAATSGSGSVNLRRTGPGDVEIQTGSGRVRVAGVRGALRVHSGSGGIDADGTIDGEWDLRASSGGITVRLPQDARFDVDARSSSGRVDIDHPVTVSETRSKKRLRGSVRGGGPRLVLRTSSGSIEIE